MPSVPAPCAGSKRGLASWNSLRPPSPKCCGNGEARLQLPTVFALIIQYCTAVVAWNDTSHCVDSYVAVRFVHSQFPLHLLVQSAVCAHAARCICSSGSVHCIVQYTDALCSTQTQYGIVQYTDVLCSTWTDASSAVDPLLRWKLMPKDFSPCPWLSCPAGQR